MILITGGAGMIGSIVAWQLNQMGINDIIIVDDIQHPEQWQNLVKRSYLDYLDKSELSQFLDTHIRDISAIIHMGAITLTTEANFNVLLENNVRLSQYLWHFCTRHGIKFLYASSAATYGDGSQGYDDQNNIQNLRPLNAYGYSKHFFDLWAMRKNNSPPLWYGFKFFNVYGPNEYHKGRMASVVFHSCRQMKQSGKIRLFQSDHPQIADGEQSRDFIYVKDTAKIITYFLLNEKLSSDHNGIYNLGTGEARIFNDIASSLINCFDNKRSIKESVEYIPLPDDLKGKYQYRTTAKTEKLRSIGYTDKLYSLEEGIADYYQNYLNSEDPYC